MSSADTLNASTDSLKISIEFNESEYDIICKVYEEHEKNVEEIENYVKSSNDCCVVDPNPAVAYLNDTVIPLLNEAMIKMLQEIIKDDCYFRPRSTLNGVDFLSEYLYNANPQYPTRKLNWTYIFDIDWVIEFLGNKPRPFYPFSLIWSRDFAAIKIQAFYRAYVTRRRADIQEIRRFWKIREIKQRNTKVEIV